MLACNPPSQWTQNEEGWLPDAHASRNGCPLSRATEAPAWNPITHTIKCPRDYTPNLGDDVVISDGKLTATIQTGVVCAIYHEGRSIPGAAAEGNSLDAFGWGLGPGITDPSHGNYRTWFIYDVQYKAAWLQDYRYPQYKKCYFPSGSTMVTDRPNAWRDCTQEEFFGCTYIGPADARVLKSEDPPQWLSDSSLFNSALVLPGSAQVTKLTNLHWLLEYMQAEVAGIDSVGFEHDFLLDYGYAITMTLSCRGRAPAQESDSLQLLVQEEDGTTQEFFSLHTNEDSCDLVWPSGSGSVAIDDQGHGTHIRVSVNGDRICIRANEEADTCEQGFGPYSRVPGALKVNGDRFLVSGLKITPEDTPPVCETTDSQVVYNGFMYRTLSGASKTGPEQNTDEEQQEYRPMPPGYNIAPDDADIVSSVIAPYTWDTWRLCTEGACWGTLHYEDYNDSAGQRKDEGKKWETSDTKYRIEQGSAYYRLLIRAPCQA